MMRVWAAVVASLALASEHVYGIGIQTERPIERDLRQEDLSRLRTALETADGDNISLHLQLAIAETTSEASFELVSFSQQRGETVLFGFVIRPKLHQLLVKYVQAGEERNQTFFYDLKVDVINWITLVFADQRLWMYVNCSRIYDRAIGNVDAKTPGNSTYDVRFASTPSDVRLVNATLTSGFEVTLWKQKCYQSLLPEVSNSRVLKLKENHDLELRLLSCEKQISEAKKQQSTLIAELKTWDGCDCHRPCWYHGEKKADHSTWKSGGEQCSCSAGQIQCTCISIPLCLSTQSLAPVEGSACPKCFYDCRIPQTSDIVNHGDWAIHEATSQKCLCQNKVWTSCKNVTSTDSSIVCDTCLGNSTCYQLGYYSCKCQSKGYGNAVVCNQACGQDYLLHPISGKCAPAWKIRLHYPDTNQYVQSIKSKH